MATAVPVATDARSLVNLAVAMLMSKRPSSAGGPDDATAGATEAAAAATTALERALQLAGESDLELSGRALLALAGAREELRDFATAAGCLRKLLAALAAPVADGTAPQLAGDASGQTALADGDAAMGKQDFAGALSKFKLALRLAAN